MVKLPSSPVVIIVPGARRLLRLSAPSDCAPSLIIVTVPSDAVATGPPAEAEAPLDWAPPSPPPAASPVPVPVPVPSVVGGATWVMACPACFASESICWVSAGGGVNPPLPETDTAPPPSTVCVWPVLEVNVALPSATPKVTGVWGFCMLTWVYTVVPRIPAVPSGVPMS